jgi:hypothetical protein
MTKLPVSVLRGIGDALSTKQEDLPGTNPSKQELKDFNAAVRWYKAECEKAGLKIYPMLSEEDL